MLESIDLPHGLVEDGDQLRKEVLAELPPRTTGDDHEVPREPTWTFPQPSTDDEIAAARLTPDCIVENYLYADVAVLVAPGGTGKTTLILYEAIHIAMGRALYGLPVRRSGTVLIITAEDSREQLLARLREITATMELNDAERRRVCDRVLVSDVRGQGFKVTITSHDEAIVPTATVDDVISGCRGKDVVMIVIDPTVSVGVGEARVNDAEQGLVDAGRRIVRSLNCCVRYIHHVGKEAARMKSTDQYTARGGSALPDGCRMVAVLQPLDQKEWRVKTGMSWAEEETGVQLTRPKGSYCPPNQAVIFISRKGFKFTSVVGGSSTAARDIAAAKIEQLLKLIAAENGKGNKPTQNSLTALIKAEGLDLARDDVRNGVALLTSRGRVELRKLEQTTGGGRGGNRGTYLWAVDGAQK